MDIETIDIVVATRNKGKLAEIESVLAGLPVRLLSIGDYPDAPEVVEDGDTFLANARKKARAIAEHTGLRALADDSGLVVDGLGGAPGVYSARYAGEDATDDDNNKKLVRELFSKKDPDTRARFVCVMCLALPGGGEIVAEGAVEGEIVETPRGGAGFGYDPLFFYPPLDKTFAELGREEKNKVSHRGAALAALARKLKGA